MTIKEFLWQYIDAEREINAKLDRLKRYRDMATKTTTVLTPDKVQSTKENNMECVIAQICDMRAEIAQDVVYLRDKQKAVTEAISRLTDNRQKAVLEWRYLNGKHIEEIAVIMNYSYKQVCRIHGKALEAVKDVLECPIKRS